ncbi:hotdog fold thioesterase [Aliibacillus thermotolerans]|uniref:Hotdog fold thioesterase n=1 Tax=Aliibacillus thermotolerans TaxID=1834418 RepID=A0ABW0U2U4_9BACI|nr:hotdog fold thioesterase [Aliibacillus thermotolerans]MDA3128485.1 hotdog fold thioesterase [Aliibacillus thermotolerans]
MKKEKLLKHFEKDTYAKLLGIKVEDVEDGYAKVSMTITDDMLNFHGSANGGATFSLADTAFAVASNSYGTTAVGVTMTMHYMKAVNSGTKLVAIAREDSKNPKLGLYRIELFDTENDDLIGIAEGMVYRKKENFIEE